MSPVRNLLLPIVVGLICVVVAGCVPNQSRVSGTESPQAKEMQARELRESTAKLVDRNDADSLAAAAVLLYADGPGAALLSSKRAMEMAPGRADLAWLQSRLCAKTPNVAPGCDPEPAERVLRNLDPANGAGWLGALERANRSNDTAAIDAVLGEMAKRERFDIYVNPLVSHLAPAFANAKVKPLPDAITFVFGQVAAFLIPAYRILGDPCKGEALKREERLQACRAIAASLVRGDALITQSFGNVMTLRTWPAESDAAQAAIEARRQSHYLRSMLGEIETGRKWTPRSAQDYVQILSANGTEDASARAQIVAAGRSADPPPGWIDSAP